MTPRRSQPHCGKHRKEESRDLKNQNPSGACSSFADALRGGDFDPIRTFAHNLKGTGKTYGFDRHLLAFLGVVGDEFEAAVDRLASDEQVLRWLRSQGVSHTAAEIEAWNQAMVSKRPDSPEKQERFSQILRQVGGSENCGVHTYFDLIDFEERRMEFEARRARSR